MADEKTGGAALATREADLPEPVVRRGITEAQWRTLANNLYPGANPQSVLMVVDYCLARKLDPLKKPCHIVPMRVKDTRSGEWGWRDVVMPGIYEYRTTAQRTGEYLGHSKPEYGPMIEHLGVKAPDWCEMTFYRYSRHMDGGRIEFPVRRYFIEVVGTTKKDNRVEVNDRWSKAPIQMLEKCTEAAGLREAFPDEFGGEATAEEMDGQPAIDVMATPLATPQPAQRLSQQAPAPALAGAAGPPTQSGGDSERRPGRAEAPADAALSAGSTPQVGAIVDVAVRPNGTLIKLDTGFQAATKDEAIVRAAQMAKDGGLRVELVTKPARDAKYAPIVIEVKPAADGAQA